MALGVWEIPDTQTPKVVEEAIKIGYRHIDTAQAYGNERGVGEGVKNSGVTRDKFLLIQRQLLKLRIIKKLRLQLMKPWIKWGQIILI